MSDGFDVMIDMVISPAEEGGGFFVLRDAANELSRQVRYGGKDFPSYHFELNFRSELSGFAVDYGDNGNRVPANVALESLSSIPGYTRRCNPGAPEFCAKNALKPTAKYLIFRRQDTKLCCEGPRPLPRPHRQLSLRGRRQ